MPVLSAGTNTTLALSQSAAFVTVNIPSGGSLTFEYPVGTVIDVATAPSKTYGPYLSGSCKITAGGRDVPYDQGPLSASRGPLVVSTAAPNNNDGMPDGTVYVQSA